MIRIILLFIKMILFVSFANIGKLANDTNNIIVYKNDLEEFRNKKKERIWEKLISNENE